MELTSSLIFDLLASPIYWLVLALVALAGFLRSARFKGFVGELKVRIATDFLLSGKEYHPLHNVTLKTPDGTTQIDHVVVSPYGVFVIETKNLKGWIFGDAKSKQWTQALFHKKYRFQNPLHQNYKHVKAIQNQLSLNPMVFHSVVVFVGKSRFKTLMPQNVVDTRAFIPFIRSKKDRLLDNKEIVTTIRQLKKAQLSFLGAGFTHVRNLKKNAEQPFCPRCGKEMVLRTAWKDSNAVKQFWGCSGYPACRATKQLA